MFHAIALHMSVSMYESDGVENADKVDSILSSWPCLLVLSGQHAENTCNQIVVTFSLQ